MFVLKDDVQDRLADDHGNVSECGRGREGRLDHSFLDYCYRRLGELVGRVRVRGDVYAGSLDWSEYWGRRGYGPFEGI